MDEFYKDFNDKTTSTQINHAELYKRRQKKKEAQLELRNKRVKLAIDFYNAGYNLIPFIEKKCACEPYEYWRTARQSQEVILRWLKKRKFQKRDGTFYILPDHVPINFLVMTGFKPATDFPALVMIDTDDAEAEAIVNARCEDTPLKQRTPSGGYHRLYRMPAEGVPSRIKTQFDEEGDFFNIDIIGNDRQFFLPYSVNPAKQGIYQPLTEWSTEQIKSLPVYDPLWLPCTAEQARAEQQLTDMEGVTFDFDSDEWPEWVPRIEKRIRQLQKHLNKCPGAIQSKNAGARKYIYPIALSAMYGYCLSPDDVYPVLMNWALRRDQLDDTGSYFPWTDREIQALLTSAASDVYRGKLGDRLKEFAYQQQYGLENTLKEKE